MPSSCGISATVLPRSAHWHYYNIINQREQRFPLCNMYNQRALFCLFIFSLFSFPFSMVRPSPPPAAPGSALFASFVCAQRVTLPTIDFRQENVGGTNTVSASFFMPRSANILKVLNALITPDQASTKSELLCLHSLLPGDLPVVLVRNRYGQVRFVVSLRSNRQACTREICCTLIAGVLRYS